MLIERRANLNDSDEFLSTPLHMAARRHHFAIVQAHIKAGSKPNAVYKRGDTPLHRAVPSCRNEIIANLLLCNGANIHSKNNDQQSPFLIAAAAGNINGMKYLIKHGANVD